MAPFDGTPPNVLVLGGGGLLGEEWMTGVLAGYEDAMGADVRRCRRFVGTSAGSIVASSLVAGRSSSSRWRPTAATFSKSRARRNETAHPTGRPALSGAQRRRDGAVGP
jgi:NTE family protein